MKFSAIVKSPTNPSLERSSGMYPTPASITSRTLAWVMSNDPRWIVPAVGARRPTSASASSVCPLPWTPAIAKTSPARTSKDTSSTTLLFRSPTTVRPETESPASPPVEGFLVTERSTARPTINVARVDAESVGFASPTTAPKRMTVMRSATAWTSRNLWVMNTMDVPAFARPFIIAINSSVSWGVRTAVGSSRTRTLASRASALIISTRC